MKKMLRNFMSLIIIGAILLSAVPVGAAGSASEDETDRVSGGTGSSLSGTLEITPEEDEMFSTPIPQGTTSAHVLYDWTASALDKDAKVFFSNLIGENDEQLHWNENGVLYMKYATQQMVLHTILNEAVGSGDSAYGLSQIKDFAGRAAVENLQVDLYPMADTDGMSAVGLSFVYAYKPSENGLNPANSGLLRIYVSEDGQNWSEDYVSVRCAAVLGSGVAQNDEEVIYYRIHSENLMDISSLEPGNEIVGLRIMPDGECGVADGSFSVCELTLTGYETAAEFEKTAAAGFGSALDTDTCRAAVVAAARNSDADDELGVILDAISLVSRAEPASIPALLNTMGLRLMDGITNQATEDVEMILEWMYEFDLMSTEYGEQKLAEYETVTTTKDIIDLNTPQQMFQGYAACKPGDILVQVTESASHAYMVTACAPAYDTQNIYIEPAESTVTYLTGSGEKKATFSELYMNGTFVPVTLDALADNAVQPVRTDGHISLADSVRVAVASNWDIDSYTLSMDGFNTTVSRPGTADIYTSADLDAAVEALKPGKYQMTVGVTVTGGMEQPEPISLEFEKKEAPEVAFTLNGLNLRLQDLLKLGFYFNVETEVELEKIGALLWTAEEYAAETDFTVNSTKAYNATADTSGTQNRYMVETEGIFAQHLDTVYHIIPYAVIADGSYVYGDMKSSSALVYANMAYNDTTGGVTENTKSIVADLLNYATKARIYFGYTEGLAAPTTAFNSILSAEDQVLGWTDHLKAAYPTVVETTGTYQPTISGVNTNLNEAIRLNFIFKGEIGKRIGYWTDSEYTALEEHNSTNVSGWATISESSAGNTVASIVNLYSFQIYDNFYVMAFDAENNGSRTYGASIASYLTSIIDKNHSSATEEELAMVELAKAMLIYGNNAMNNPDVNKGSN